MDSNIIRIDRAIADNILDIEKSFGKQAGIVQDFIIFISWKLKIDPFRFTRFTIKEFCEAVGRRREELAVIHSDFLDAKKSPPEIAGQIFNTVMDYAMYSMMQQKIMFSTDYEVKGNGKIFKILSYSILKDVKLNTNRKSKEEKIYEVQMSDELLNGFLYRYYTVNLNTYRLVGKGRGGDARKRVLIYLSKINHVLFSMNTTNETTMPVDRLCRLAGIKDKLPSHRKQNLTRLLTVIQNKGKFPFQFDYKDKYGEEAYHLHMKLQALTDKLNLQKEHSMYLRLLEGLKGAFDNRQDKSRCLDEKDSFQYWLTQSHLDNSIKAEVLSRSIYVSFNLSLSAGSISHILTSKNGLLNLMNVQ